MCLGNKITKEYYMNISCEKLDQKINGGLKAPYA